MYIDTNVYNMYIYTHTYISTRRCRRSWRLTRTTVNKIGIRKGGWGEAADTEDIDKDRDK